jgi:AcrR family transcriptional regulator
VPRMGLDARRVAGAAADIADAEGLRGVTLARVAAELGVRSPSLYNHVDGRDGLIRAVALEGLRDLAVHLRRAAIGRSGRDALVATARAYRDYARAHPGRYAATVAAPAPGDAEHEALADEAVDVMRAVLRAWGLEGDDAIHATRAFRSAVHGFVAIELSGGFGMPVDVDASFERLIQTLAAGLGRDVTPRPARARAR